VYARSDDYGKNVVTLWLN